LTSNVEVPFRQQPQHLAVADCTRRRSRVLNAVTATDKRVARIVLVRPSSSEHTRPRRQRRRDINDGFAGGDELLREQNPRPSAPSIAHVRGHLVNSRAC